MTSILTILLIIFILVVVLFIALIKYSSSFVDNERKDEDHNYQSLKKLFFAVSASNINTSYLADSNSVYGILIELKSNEKKILFACYITGFAGYYQSKGGGLIGGNLYQENDNNVQHDLMKLCNSKELIGENQSIMTRKMAIRMTMKANKLLSKAIKTNSWNDNENTTNFWFLTKEGIFFAEEQNTEIENSCWNALVEEGFSLVKELHKI